MDVSHPCVIYIGDPEGHHYNTWKGPGWYFVDPTDDSRINIQGPYTTEALAESEYYAYCWAAYD